MREQEGFDKCDPEHFNALLYGSIDEAADIDAVLARHVDRKTSELSPIEHGVLMIGTSEALALTEDQRVRILDLFLLEKAAYEIAYEVRSRPHWLPLPLAGFSAIASRLLETNS